MHGHEQHISGPFSEIYSEDNYLLTSDLDQNIVISPGHLSMLVISVIGDVRYISYVYFWCFDPFLSQSYCVSHYSSRLDFDLY